MKKYLLTSAAALAFCGLITSCTHDLDYDGEAAAAQNSVVKTYEQAFVTAFGQPDPNQEWGFGPSTAASRAMTRSFESPALLDITQPYDEAWVANYNLSACEPNNENVIQNAINFQYPTWQWSSEYNNKRYTTGFTAEEQAFYNANIKPYDNGEWGYGADAWYEVYKRLIAGGYSSWANVTAEPTFVRNFKITGTWNGDINVVATEGLTDGVANGNERTVVVTGTWNLTADQRVGAKGKIIVARGGTINISEGKTLSSVNEAQIVVLPGGQITGKGAVAFHNGTDAALQSSNWGTINVGQFNNNGGNFFNNGTLIAGVMDGGAGNSRYYNRSLIRIGQTGSSANLRIYNACQFYCEGDMRARNYEGVMGSALICDGELTFSSSADGTNDASTVGLATGALVQCGRLYNNGTSWSGPTSNGYAVLDVEDKITYLNWEQDHPELGGYFANNIYVYVNDWTNAPGGNGMGGEDAKSKFQKVQNKAGNGNVEIVSKGNAEVIPADNDFVKGESGCTPGFNKGGNPPTPPTPPTPSSDVIRVICEDLSVTQASDWDFNDVVFDVELINNNTQAQITLRAAGGTLPLWVGTEDHEVHEEFAKTNEDYAITTSSMVTTTTKGDGKKYTFKGLQPATFTVDIQPEWTEGASSEGDGLVKAVAKNMPVKVYKMVNGGTKTWVTLECEKGKATAKVAVKNDYQWCDERDHINQVYQYEDMRGNEYGGFTMFSRGILDANEWYKYKGPITDEMVQEYTGQ